MNKQEELRANFIVNRTRYRSKKELTAIEEQLDELIASAISEHEAVKVDGFYSMFQNGFVIDFIPSNTQQQGRASLLINPKDMPNINSSRQSEPYKPE
jgi:hypothetical protein